MLKKTNIKLFMVKWRININMNSKKIYSPYYYLISRHLTLSDFGLKINGKFAKEKQFKTLLIQICFLNSLKRRITVL